MTTPQIIVLSVVFISDFFLSIVYPIYAFDNRILPPFNILRMAFTWGGANNGYGDNIK